MMLPSSMLFVTVTLKPDLFEGFRFDFARPLGQFFFLSHRYPSQCPSFLFS